MKRLVLALPFLLTTVATAQMAVPPVEMSDPGATGRRIDADGILGNFYPAPKVGRHGAILLLGGSEGALGGSMTRVAKALQADGFNVLHLSYFRAPEQSEALVHVPVEIFANGLAWLGKQPSVDARRIALVGGSKGAEAVLLIASRTPQVRAVVAGMPSSFVWPGMSWTGPVDGASWSAGGKDLSALPYGQFTPPNVGSIYESGLAKAAEHGDAAIAIEKSRAPVLLVCGEADTLWPSCTMARQLKARDPRVTVLAYDDAGHAVFGVPVDATSPSYARLAALGGTPAGNAAARIDSWPKVLAFLHKALDR